MSNSPLVSHVRISPNKNSPRNHKIDTITIHCYVGQASVESMGSWFGQSDAQASSNYGIGSDGRIGMFVEEKDRSWCSSSSSNDNRAITIECASDKKAPYAINDKVYASLIDLCVDICKRNDIPSLKWKADKSLIGQVDKQNMTVHKWFKNKDCPGEYIYSRLGQIAEAVNKRLSGESSGENSNQTQSGSYPNTPFKVQVKVPDLNYRYSPSMSGEVLGQTGIGIFTITEVVNGWGHLKSDAGWIYLENPDYCEVVKSASGDGSFLVQVATSLLNIRSGPGTNYGRCGTIAEKGIYTIVETENGPGSTLGWGFLKSGAGWISLDFVKRI